MPAHRAPRLRSLALLALGVSLALALGAVPTYEAWRAARHHRAAAERTLQEYAGFAARSYVQMLGSRTYIAVTSVFAPLGAADKRHAGGPMALRHVRRAADEWMRCRCGPALRPEYLYRVRLRDGAIEFDGPAPSAARRAWLLAEARVVAGWPAAKKWSYAASADTTGPDLHFAYMTVWRDTAGVPVALYGFGVHPDTLRAALLADTAKAHVPLLPVAGAERIPADSLLSLAAVDSAQRRVLPISRRAYPLTYAAVVPGNASVGELQIRAALNPAVAGALLVGGLPPSRTPLLVAMLALTVALLGTLVWVAARAMELARLRADFVASVSHELRTPLAQILLFAESVQLGRMRSRRDVLRASDVIVTETRRLMQLVGNLLLFGRTARGAYEPARTPTALAPLVREVLDGFAPVAAAAESRVRAPRLDDVVVPADGDALRQVLLNLLDNAVKYGPPGQVIGVGVALVGDRARVWVEDEGPGIPAADRARAWEPFVRLRRERETGGAGSGIGLAVVREIVERHGGTACIESTPAGGACVVVELPRARERAAHEALAADRRRVPPPPRGAPDAEPAPAERHDAVRDAERDAARDDTDGDER
jgi:signal transduction histidine kinase